MKGAVLADTGPLVALFNAADRHHRWAVACLAEISSPLQTSEAVVTEVFFLLGRLPRSRAAFEQFWLEGGLRVSLESEAQKDALVRLLRKYADLPMSFADATLVRLSELLDGAVVWSLDSHFQRYRRRGRQVIPLFHWPPA